MSLPMGGGFASDVVSIRCQIFHRFEVKRVVQAAAYLFIFLAKSIESREKENLGVRRKKWFYRSTGIDKSKFAERRMKHDIASCLERSNLWSAISFF